MWTLLVHGVVINQSLTGVDSACRQPSRLPPSVKKLSVSEDRQISGASVLIRVLSSTAADCWCLVCPRCSALLCSITRRNWMTSPRLHHAARALLFSSSLLISASPLISQSTENADRFLVTGRQVRSSGASWTHFAVSLLVPSAAPRWTQP